MWFTYISMKNQALVETKIANLPVNALWKFDAKVAEFGSLATK